MRLILSLALLWAFSSTAGAIRCEVCIDFNDLDCAFGGPEDCPADSDACFNAFIREADGTERIYRRCAKSELCPVNGPVIVAANVGVNNATGIAECCGEDLCNNKVLPYPAPPEANSLTCPAICEEGDAECNPVVYCNGEEDTCFQSDILKDRVPITVAGCGTSNVCSAANEIRFVPFLEEVGTVLGTPTCFSATTTTTPAPTTTTPEPTTTTPEPTTTYESTTTYEPNTVYESTPMNQPLTTVNKKPIIVLAKFKFLLAVVRRLSLQINQALLQQQAVVILQLHFKILDDQSRLLAQQEELPIDHHFQLPLYYQQCLLVNNHQLLLHQIHYALCGQQNLLELFQKQKQALYQLQALLQAYHYHLLPHYAGHVQSSCHQHGGHGGGD